MRIGADGSHLRWPTGGMSRYLDGLLHELEAQLPGEDRLDVYYNSWGGPRLFGERSREHVVRMPRSTLFNQVGIPLALIRDRCDVYLGAANLCPTWGRVPSVVVMLDCRAFRDPDGLPKADGSRLRRWQRAAAHAAGAVVAISEWTAGECEHWLSLPRSRVRVIEPGIDPRLSPEHEGGETAERARLARDHGVVGRFVLQVGAHEPHKIAVRPESLRHLAGGSLTLVRCGPPGPAPALPGTLDLGFVDEATLRRLYRCAEVVCVASRHEGFGFPVVEAMASGTPVVATRTSALPEAGGAAAVYATSDDEPGIIAALRSLLEDPEERERRRTAGLVWAARFSWERAASQMLEVLRSVARNGRTRSSS